MIKPNVETIETNIENVETNIENVVTVVKLKRGRKSKQELFIINEQKILKELALKESALKDNITCSIEETFDSTITTTDITSDVTNDITNDITNDNDKNSSLDENTDIQKNVSKKRGRKPKGGKIIQQIVPQNHNMEPKPNIILHLKCSLKDLQTNTLLSSNVEAFNFSSCKGDLSYEIIGSEENVEFKDIITPDNNDKYYEDDISIQNNEDTNYNKEHETKEIWKKLKQLEHNLHINNISDKKSACFWCTYEFDNPPVYIPKHFIKETYHVYGCYCSPECATAFLMEENIDSSTKFERYYLINHIYAKIYNFNKNIKPAPNPYYMLDKYYGNLNIQEYRSLLRNERLFLIVDKPLTRILPELHEDNDDFIINNKIIPSNTYQIKKKLQKKTQNKNTIFNDKFGTTQ
jgi:hypothetical protein